MAGNVALVISGYWPWGEQSGTAARVGALVSALAERYNVCFVYVGRVEPEGAAPSPISVRVVVDSDIVGFPSLRGVWSSPIAYLSGAFLRARPQVSLGWLTPRVTHALRDLSSAEVLFTLAVRPWAAEAALASGLPNIIVDVDDVPSSVLRAWYTLHNVPRWRWLDLWRTRRYERRLASRFPLLLVSNVSDADKLGDSRRVLVVPNAVNVPHDVGIEDNVQDQVLLFVGYLGWFPNEQAVLWFARKVLPEVRKAHPRVRFRVVGAAASQHLQSAAASLGIELAGYVVDLREEYQSAALVVVPLKSGSGTSIKTMEAMAHGRAVVSTPFGCRGLAVVDGQGIAIADEEGGFASRVSQLLCDGRERRRLGENGRRYVMECHSWRTVGHAFVEALERVGIGRDGKVGV